MIATVVAVEVLVTCTRVAEGTGVEVALDAIVEDADVVVEGAGDTVVEL